MRKYSYLISAVILFFCFCGDDNGGNGGGDGYGSIYGVITDKTTGEPVPAAGVQLRPSGETTVTGSDGRYEFSDIEVGTYVLQVTKTGYTELIDPYDIKVSAGRSTKRDVQIQKLYSTLSTFTDSRDGKVYRVETFGFAVWMIEDMRYNSATGMYDWTQATTVCPSGWHLPGDSEWRTLNLSVQKTENEFFRGSGWWSATDDDRYVANRYTEAYYWYGNSNGVTRGSYSHSKAGTFSVRCIQG